MLFESQKSSKQRLNEPALLRYPEGALGWVHDSINIFRQTPIKMKFSNVSFVYRKNKSTEPEHSRPLCRTSFEVHKYYRTQENEAGTRHITESRLRPLQLGKKSQLTRVRQAFSRRCRTVIHVFKNRHRNSAPHAHERWLASLKDTATR